MMRSMSAALTEASVVATPSFAHAARYSAVIGLARPPCSAGIAEVCSDGAASRSQPLELIQARVRG